MSERRGRALGFLLSAAFVAAGMASCAHPALSQHPVHNPPPPPPRPPAHQPARQSPPPKQVVKQQQPPVAPKSVTPQPPVREQPSGTSGTPTIQQPPAVGTRVSGGVPHPPVRPWEQRNADIPPSERPPPGMCRVWLDKVPAASQPAPTTCSKAIQRHPPNGHVIFGEDGRRPTATRVSPATPSEPSSPESPLADH